MNRELDGGGTALDLGCGIGCWGEYQAVYRCVSTYRMPWMIRSLTKSATAIGLVNVSLVVAWLVSYSPPLIAATVVSLIAAAFLLSYLLSFARRGSWWIKGVRL